MDGQALEKLTAVRNPWDDQRTLYHGYRFETKDGRQAFLQRQLAENSSSPHGLQLTFGPGLVGILGFITFLVSIALAWFSLPLAVKLQNVYSKQLLL